MYYYLEHNKTLKHINRKIYEKDVPRMVQH